MVEPYLRSIYALSVCQNVLPVGIEPTSYLPQRYILSIERWELGVSLYFLNEFGKSRLLASSCILVDGIGLSCLVESFLNLAHLEHSFLLITCENEFLERFHCLGDLLFPTQIESALG